MPTETAGFNRFKINFIREAKDEEFRNMRHAKLGVCLLCCHLVCEHSCASVIHRSGGVFSKIFKKRPHKEAQTPDNGELTLAQILNERPAGGEGKENTRTISLGLNSCFRRVSLRQE